MWQGNMDTEQDQARAISLFRWASGLGHAQAPVVLGAIYYNGVLGQVDYEQAFEYVHSPKLFRCCQFQVAMVTRICLPGADITRQAPSVAAWTAGSTWQQIGRAHV